MINNHEISKIYEEYINKKKGEKGKYLQKVAKDMGISIRKLYILLKSHAGSLRGVKRRELRHYTKDDILYAIHYARKGKLNLMTVCGKLIIEKRVMRKSYYPAQNSVRAFYLAVRRYLKSSKNLGIETPKRITKDMIKKALLLSSFSDREKLLLIMAIDGKTKLGELNEDLKDTAKKLMVEGYITRKNLFLVPTPKLKTYILGRI